MIPPSLEAKQKLQEAPTCHYSKKLLARFAVVRWQGMIGPPCDCAMDKDVPPCTNTDCQHHPGMAIDKDYGMNMNLIALEKAMQEASA